MSDVLITTLGTSFVALVSIFVTNSLSAYRIKQLECKVDKHNTLIERMYKVEGRMDTICAEIIDIKNEKR